MIADSRDQITGVVLAGGRARRMGGVNKALIDYQGQALFRYAVDNLLGCAQRVVINTSRDLEAFRQLGFDTIDDGEFADHGPIAGVYAALRYASTPFVAIAACDQLALPASVYSALCAAASDARGAYACTATDQIPTCAVLPVSLLDAALEALRAERLALTKFMRAHAASVTFDDVAFGNVNASDGSANE